MRLSSSGNNGWLLLHASYLSFKFYKSYKLWVYVGLALLGEHSIIYFRKSIYIQMLYSFVRANQS